MAKAATTKKITKTDNRLCVISALHHGDDRFFGPVLHGSGKVQTYLPNQLDERIKRLKIITTRRALTRHLYGKSSRKPVIAKVVHVQEITGWKNREFASA